MRFFSEGCLFFNRGCLFSEGCLRGVYFSIGGVFFNEYTSSPFIINKYTSYSMHKLTWISLLLVHH